MNLGLKRDVCLFILGITKDQLYYKSTGNKPGKRASTTTVWRDPATKIKYEISNEEVVNKAVEIKLDPDQANGYRLICFRLKILGYYINHKKLYRLFKEYHLLEKARKKIGRDFVKYRRVCPSGPLEVIEMDIKYVWVEGKRKYAYILTVIDTFTRYVLSWDLGFTMKSVQVKKMWEHLIVEYLQPLRSAGRQLDIEIRNDNGKQFCSKMIMAFFAENQLDQVFTHPYTPEENGHVESFHKTLGVALKGHHFTGLESLKNRLLRFYKTYNNIRSHGSTLGIAPAKFWSLYDQNKIEVVPLEKRRQKFILSIPYQDILTLPKINDYDFG